METDPTKNVDEVIKNIHEEPVVIENGEVKLEGRLFIPAEKKEKNPGVLFLHGWKSKQDGSFDIARQLGAEGIISLTFNLREHGKEDGNPDGFSKKDYLDDAKSAYDFLSSREDVDPEKINVVGSSFGSYLAAILSEEKDINRLLLRVPADYSDDDFELPGVRGSEDEEIMEWRKRLHGSNETKSLRALRKFNREVLIVESGKDDTVPHETVQSYVDAVPSKEKVKHILMPDAGHSIKNDEKSKLEFKEIVSNWMK